MSSQALFLQVVPFPHRGVDFPGARYAIDEAFSRAATVSSTVRRTVVWTELKAPPAPRASAVAAIET